MQAIQERINWLKTVLDSLDKALQIGNTFTALVHALVLAPPVHHGLKKQHGVHSNTSELPQ